MKFRLFLMFMSSILLVSCFGPEGSPILDGEQRLVIQNSYYEIIIEDDTTFSFHLDYYVSRDSCRVTSYVLDWTNVFGVGVNWSPGPDSWERAGVWYEIDGNYKLNNSIDNAIDDPVITLRGGGTDSTLTITDTLRLREDANGE